MNTSSVESRPRLGVPEVLSMVALTLGLLAGMDIMFRTGNQAHVLLVHGAAIVAATLTAFGCLLGRNALRYVGLAASVVVGLFSAMSLAYTLLGYA